MRPRGRIAVAEAATATLGFGAIGAVGVAQPTQWEWGFASSAWTDGGGETRAVGGGPSSSSPVP